MSWNHRESVIATCKLVKRNVSVLCIVVLVPNSNPVVLPALCFYESPWPVTSTFVSVRVRGFVCVVLSFFFDHKSTVSGKARGWFGSLVTSFGWSLSLCVNMNFPFSCVILNQLRQQLPIDDLRTSDVNANICPSTDRQTLQRRQQLRELMYIFCLFLCI